MVPKFCGRIIVLMFCLDIDESMRTFGCKEILTRVIDSHSRINSWREHVALMEEKIIDSLPAWMVGVKVNGGVPL